MLRIPDENEGRSLSQALDQLLCNLAAEKVRLLHELSDLRRLPQPDLFLEPVSAEFYIRDGDSYLIVQYKSRFLLDTQSSPKKNI